MDLDDRKKIRTPEGLDLELTLAGLGSRIVAAVADTALAGLLVAATAYAFAALGMGLDSNSMLIAGVAIVALAAVVLGYFVGFEAFNGGRTPGKRWTGIRVVSTDGDTIGFLSAFLRNLLRVVDFLPVAYAVGAVSILVTSTNQRLGDIAASTVVVRERLPAMEPVGLDAVTDLPAWDVSRVTDEDLDVVRRFATRRPSLSPERADAIAATIAARIRPRVGTDVAVSDDTRFLLTVLALKARQTG